MAEHVYKPSERVEISGVYRISHNGHRTEHEATLLEDETFPECAVCHDTVRFTLIHRAPSIRGDEDLRQK